MEDKYSAEMFKHLEKQSEVLMKAYRSMSHELHRLQLEEEMYKFYEVTCGQGLNQKRVFFCSFNVNTCWNRNAARKLESIMFRFHLYARTSLG
ncbi:hypothetical protein MKW92_013820 [Papaver armeniacum]|nr:hypothetical protein MKW92_013820 [Papaver armeniacum]